MLADFCRHSSDPFRLSAALSQLADIYASSGNYARAEECLEEMVERNKGDERLVARLNQLRAKSGGTAESQPTEDHTGAFDSERCRNTRRPKWRRRRSS